MKSFREIIRFIKFVQINQEALQIEDVREVVVVLILLFKGEDYKRMFRNFLLKEVKRKTMLYSIVESEFKNDAKRAYQKYNFLGRFGVKGNGEDKFSRLKHLIYNYGKFNGILKDNDEDLWL